jgi:FKBP-type peptidyl-prolyl cis-trans isomerase
MFKFQSFFALIFIVLALVSCSGTEDLGPEKDQITNYISTKKLTITETTASGLRFILTKANASGAVLRSRQMVSVKYVGKFIAGSKTDKVFDSGSFTFQLGIGEVVPGFDEGIAKLKVGEAGTIIFPSNLGYGASGIGDIPPNTPLLFEIEVISAK